MTTIQQIHPPPGRSLRLVVLLSGGGSNMAALLGAGGRADYPAQVVAVGADRSDAGGLAVAAGAGVPTFVDRVADHPDRAAWDRSLADRIADHAPDLVVSAGFLKLLGPAVRTRFAGRLLNTHNSLLPAFPGMDGPAAALAYGVKIAGATLFVIDDGLDTGPIIAQTAVPVEADDTVATLTERIKVAERAQLVETIGRMARHGWTINGRTVSIP